MLDTRMPESTTPSLKWNVEHPLSAKGVSGKVQKWLYEKPPCSIVKLSESYKIDDNQNTVRAAVYSHTANTPVFSNRKGRIAYGLRIVADDTELIITLPGLRIEWIALDYNKSYRDAVKASLDDRSGPYARKLLFESLQKRSVDLIAKQMRDTRVKHNGYCKICLKMEEKECGKARSSHLISRAIVFWVSIDTIVHTNLNPLSEEALRLLKLAIELNPYHSNPNYMIPLCRKHDKAVIDALKKVSKDVENVDPKNCYFSIN